MKIAKVILKWIGVLLCVGGIFFILGTVGADDRAVMSGVEVFTFSELMVRCLIGFCFAVGGFLIYWVSDNA